MEKLQGISVPRFFGHYQHIKGNGECVDLILLEYISIPRLSTIHDLPTNEIESLRTQCMDILNQIHACGVAHNDIGRHNIFWNRSERRVIIYDFALATTSNDSSSDCKERDEVFMHFAVNDDKGELKNEWSKSPEYSLWN